MFVPLYKVANVFVPLYKAICVNLKQGLDRYVLVPYSMQFICPPLSQLCSTNNTNSSKHMLICSSRMQMLPRPSM